MAYYSNIPNLDNAKNYDAPLIKDNFNEIKTSWDINHQPLGGGTSDGKHKQIDLTDQHANIPIVSGVNEVTLYADTGALYLSKDTGDAIDFTTITPTTAVKGFTILPSGLKMIWDTFTLMTGSLTYTSTFTGVDLTTLYNLSYSAFNNGAEDSRDVTFTYTTTGAPITAVNFTRSLSGADVEFSYMIIGV